MGHHLRTENRQNRSTGGIESTGQQGAQETRVIREHTAQICREAQIFRWLKSAVSESAEQHAGSSEEGILTGWHGSQWAQHPALRRRHGRVQASGRAQASTNQDWRPEMSCYKHIVQVKDYQKCKYTK